MNDGRRLKLSSLFAKDVLLVFSFFHGCQVGSGILGVSFSTWRASARAADVEKLPCRYDRVQDVLLHADFKKPKP